MNVKPRFSTEGQKRLGCLLVVMGSVFGAFGLAALLGISKDIELEFFGIDVDSRSERLWWVLGSLAVIAVGLLLFRPRNRAL